MDVAFYAIKISTLSNVISVQVEIASPKKKIKNLHEKRYAVEKKGTSSEQVKIPYAEMSNRRVSVFLPYTEGKGNEEQKDGAGQSSKLEEAWQNRKR